jgi:hypothetical protein
MDKSEVIRKAMNDVQIKKDLQSPQAKAEFERVREHLAQNGVTVSMLEDIKLDNVVWRRSIPLLLDCLPLVTTDEAKETLIRLLSVPFAKTAVFQLIDQFRSSTNEYVRWAAGNALEVLASDEIAGEMIQIAGERKYGWSRQMVVMGLGKLKSAEAFETAVQCLSDEEVVLHALSALTRRKDPSAIDHIEPLLASKKASVRKAAAKAVLRLSRRKP